MSVFNLVRLEVIYVRLVGQQKAVIGQRSKRTVIGQIARNQLLKRALDSRDMDIGGSSRRRNVRRWKLVPEEW
jgi:hypothetical protein